MSQTLQSIIERLEDGDGQDYVLSIENARLIQAEIDAKLAPLREALLVIAGDMTEIPPGISACRGFARRALKDHQK